MTYLLSCQSIYVLPSPSEDSCRRSSGSSTPLSSAFSNAFFQGIVLCLSSKNEYPETPTLARIVPELRSTTSTRVDLYLEPPPSFPLTFRLAIP